MSDTIEAHYTLANGIKISITGPASEEALLLRVRQAVSQQLHGLQVVKANAKPARLMKPTKAKKVKK